MTSEFVKAYTIKEVSKKLNIPSGTLRQWEKDLKGLLVIPRSKQGARYYTDTEIDLLGIIKQMRDKNLSKDMIRELLKKNKDEHSEAGSESLEISLLPNTKEEPLPIDKNKQELELFLSAMETFKGQLIADVREEIRIGIRKDVLDDVKREISKGSVHTVKSLSDSIYKSGERTMAEIEELTGQIQKASEQTSETFGTLSKRISKASKGTSEQIRSLAHRVADSSEAAAEEFKTMIHYISSSAEVTHTEISSLIETLNTDREIYIETMTKDRKQFWENVNERETIFKELINGFRTAAAAEETAKPWWKFWQ